MSGRFTYVNDGQLPCSSASADHQESGNGILYDYVLENTSTVSYEFGVYFKSYKDVERFVIKFSAYSTIVMVKGQSRFLDETSVDQEAVDRLVYERIAYNCALHPRVVRRNKAVPSNPKSEDCPFQMVFRFIPELSALRLCAGKIGHSHRPCEDELKERSEKLRRHEDEKMDLLNCLRMTPHSQPRYIRVEHQGHMKAKPSENRRVDSVDLPPHVEPLFEAYWLKILDSIDKAKALKGKKVRMPQAEDYGSVQQDMNNNGMQHGHLHGGHYEEYYMDQHVDQVQQGQYGNQHGFDHQQGYIEGHLAVDQHQQHQQDHEGQLLSSEDDEYMPNWCDIEEFLSPPVEPCQQDQAVQEQGQHAIGQSNLIEECDAAIDRYLNDFSTGVRVVGQGWKKEDRPSEEVDPENCDLLEELFGKLEKIERKERNPQIEQANDQQHVLPPELQQGPSTPQRRPRGRPQTKSPQDKISILKKTVQKASGSPQHVNLSPLKEVFREQRQTPKAPTPLRHLVINRDPMLSNMSRFRLAMKKRREAMEKIDHEKNGEKENQPPQL